MSKTVKALVCILVLVIILLSASNALLCNQIADLNKKTNELKARSEMLSILAQMQFQADSELQKLDRSILASSEQLSSTGLQGSQTRAILRDLVASSPFIIDAVTVDKDGFVVAVEPRKYSSIEGADVSWQEQVIQLHKTKRAVMSEVMRLVEGFDGVFVAAPIFTTDGKFIGSLSIVIQPDAILNATAASVLAGTPYTAWAMQIDGRVIYDHDPGQLGKMLFSDPIYSDYPELLNLGTKIVSQRSGYGTYHFYGTLEEGQVVEKEAFWTTVGIYDTEWRLVIIRVVGEQSL